MVYKDSLDEKKRHFHFGEFLHFQFGTNSLNEDLAINQVKTMAYEVRI